MYFTPASTSVELLPSISEARERLEMFAGLLRYRCHHSMDGQRRKVIADILYGNIPLSANIPPFSSQGSLLVARVEELYEQLEAGYQDCDSKQGKPSSMEEVQSDHSKRISLEQAKSLLEIERIFGILVVQFSSLDLCVLIQEKGAERKRSDPASTGFSPLNETALRSDAKEKGSDLCSSGDNSQVSTTKRAIDHDQWTTTLTERPKNRRRFG
ncbi:hypothetical protein XA68_10717 [Ophiocordyceps unilateralis]|uniref:Uncharacterized protein n=1 Tax=Ophiocordyceps unilateralis TaxID=268505 RepID=A0A2A9PR79_OPHUN|nr:hypothetical protein XA68_10717 [Ophiocordyceps unilateralis]